VSGDVACWGINIPPRLSGATLGAKFISIAGPKMLVGVMEDAGVFYADEAVTEDGGRSFTGRMRQVTAGEAHVCGITALGSVECIGRVRGSANIAVLPFEGSFLDLASLEHTVCGLRVDGRLTCIGENEFGQAPRP